MSLRERRRSEKSRSEDKDRDRVDFSKLIEGYDKMVMFLSILFFEFKMVCIYIIV